MAKLNLDYWAKQIEAWLPVPSHVQIVHRPDWTYRVDVVTCGRDASFYVSMEPEDWRPEWIKGCVDSALMHIWGQSDPLPPSEWRVV